MSESSAALEPARLAWRDNTPYSLTYEDIYHSPDGVDEANRVFFEPAQLGELLATRLSLTVAELGFGSALNLATLLQRWRQSAQPRLHYLACEQHPLRPADWQRVLQHHGARVPPYEVLGPLYPPLVPGWHRRQLAGGRILLSLFWGSAEQFFDELAHRQRTAIDLWLLDGFAPDRNPELWHDGLLSRLTQLSRAGTQVTTFTAAGRVRRALANAGFAMRRIDQRPFKRESLAGILERAPGAEGTATDANATLQAEPRGHDAPLWAELAQRARGDCVEVIGAGIAGACLARQLAEAGLACTVFDAGPGPMGASHLPALVAHTRLLADGSRSADQRALAQLFSSHFLAPFAATADSAQTPGALQLAGDDAATRKLERLSTIYAHGDWCQRLSGAAIDDLARGFAPQGSRELALWFPEAWVVDPPALITRLLDHPLIETRWHTPVNLQASSKALRCLTVGTSIRAWDPAAHLELAPLGGQLDRVATSAAPAAALVGAGYCLPTAQPGTGVLVGGNYEYRPGAPALASANNLAQLPANVAARWQRRYRSIRLTTSDRQPIVGLFCDSTGTATTDRPLLCLGFGSQGMTQAPLAASVLVSRLTGIVPPLSSAQEQDLDARRFVARQRRRGAWRGAR